MVMQRFAQTVRLRTTGPHPTLQDGTYSNGFGPLHFVSGPDYYPTRTRTGITVTEELALSQTAVYACVRLISTTAGGQPIHIYTKNDAGEHVDTEDESNAYLWDRPNQEMTNQTYWETVLGHEVMGDAFLFVTKNRRGEVMQRDDARGNEKWGIWYIEPWRVVTGRTSDGLKIYEIDGGEYVMFDYADGGEIIHVPNFGRSPLRGLSPIKMAAETIALGISALEFAERFFSSSAVPSGVLSTDAILTQVQADALRESWEAKHGGNRAGGTAVLGHGTTFQPIASNPHDAQLLDERKFTGAQIAQLFGVPPHLIGEVDRSTSWGTGIEEQTRGFLTFTLQYHINRFEQAINYALLNRYRTRQYVKFDMSGLLRPNTKDLMDVLTKGVVGGILTPNEARADLDHPPLEGGDDLILPVNMTPAQNLGEPTPEEGAQE